MASRKTVTLYVARGLHVRIEEHRDELRPLGQIFAEAVEKELKELEVNRARALDVPGDKKEAS